MKFKPMLAGKVDLAQLRFPLLASPKLDGVRCLITQAGPVSRKILPIPNKEVRALFSEAALIGLDGELIAGSPTDRNAMQNTTSKVMTIEGDAKGVTFHIFDRWDMPTLPFAKRLAQLDVSCHPRLRIVKHKRILDMAALSVYESQCVSQGYEGVMLRAFDGPYKYGRSTTREGFLLKLKRWEDAEGVVIGFEELEHNDNELQHDALGHAKRSTAKAGKRGAEKLGALLLRCEQWPDVTVRVGTGFSDEDRRVIWGLQSKYLGLQATFKFIPHGVKEAPRFPVFKAWRED